MYPFTKITAVPGKLLNGSPARCNRKTKEAWVNADLWQHLTETQQQFILQHEAGHIVRQTKNELLADQYAFKKLSSEGKSLKEMVGTLTHLLSNRPGHRRRAYELLQQAKNYDKKHNNMFQDYQKYSDYQESFLGIGRKKYQGMSKAEKKAAQKEESINRLAHDKEKRRLSIEGKTAKNQSRLILAQQGIDQKGGGLFGALEGIGGALLGKVTGGGIPGIGGGGGDTPVMNEQMSQGSSGGGYQQQQQPYQGEAAAPKEKKSKNTMLIVGGAIAAVLIIIVVLVKSKK